MESPPFGSLAQLGILLIPVGSIKRPAFDKWAGILRSFDHIRLADIPPDPRDDRARFLPSALSNGVLHLTYPSHPPPASHAPYALFRPSAFCLGVIGIADCSQSSSLPAILAEFYGALGEIFGPDPVFPLAGRCYAFDPGDASTDLDVGGALEGLTVIPTVVGDKRIYIGTLLANFCGAIIGEFAGLTRVLEEPARTEELHRFLLPTLSHTFDDRIEDPSSPVNGVSLPSKQERNGDSHLSYTAPRSPTLPRSPTFPMLSSTNGGPRSTGLGLGHPSPSSRSPSPLPKRASTMNASSHVHGFKSRSASIAMHPASKKKGATIFNSTSPRLGKIIADLYLLSGRIGDAIQWYTDAILSLKSTTDIIWQASALEGLCVASVLDAWNRQDQPAIPPATSGHDPPQEQWVDILDKLTQAVSLYWKATPTGPEETSLAVFELTAITTLYAEAVIRVTRFLLAIWSSKGWGPHAFLTLMRSALPHAFIPDPPSDGQMHQMTATTGISRLQIASVAGQAHGPFILNLLPFDRSRVLSFLATTYSCLKFKRKEAYILRELQAVVMELIVSAREETSGSTRESVNRSLTVLTPTVSEFGDKTSGALAVRESELTEGNESIVRLIKHICDIYGIPMSTVNIVEPRDSSIADENEESSLAEFERRIDLFGWPELQVGVMREAISIAELLPDYPSVAQLALTALRILGPYLAAAEQHHLLVVSTRALATARRRGDTRRLQYWSENPLVAVDIAPLPVIRMPIQHSIRDLEIRTADEHVLAAVRKDPFLYDPRSSRAGGVGKVIAVQNELLEFIVTLRNPHSFDFDIPAVSLSTAGISFHSPPMGVTVAANSYEIVRLSGVPTDSGRLIVRGCTVQLGGSLPRTFILPTTTPEDESRRDKKQIALQADLEIIKDVGLDSRPTVKVKKRSSMFGPSKGALPSKGSQAFLECLVVPELPFMRVKRTSLTHGAVMLYDGETSQIRLTLENASSLSVNLLRVTFEDSTMGPARDALADADLSVTQAYETEYDLLNRPVFTWQEDSESVDIPGGKTVSLRISCLGKTGCTAGSIQVSYAALLKDASTTPDDSFYTRQIIYPVLVTVYHTLECLSMDILPFTPPEQVDDANSQGHKSRDHLYGLSKDVDWCLFAVDVHNRYGIPFEVTLEGIQEGAPSIRTTHLVAAGSTSRMMLPLKREYLRQNIVNAPIPSLIPRQFLLSKEGLSKDAAEEQRMLFWYREQLFKSVKASWKDPLSGRSGELSLRKQPMTTPMLEAFRADLVHVALSVETEIDGQSSATQGRFANREVPANSFVYVKITTTNLHSDAAYMTLSLDAMPPTPMSFVLFEGSLTDLPLGRVERGETVEQEVCLMFLAEGRFDWAASVRLYGEQEVAGRKEICIVAIGE